MTPYHLPSLLHDFRRVRKITKSDYQLRHVCPSARASFRTEQLGSHWTGFHEIWYFSIFRKPVPVAARSKAQGYGRSPAEIVGSNPTGDIDVCLLWVLLCCQVEVSATDRSLVQRSPTDCGASLCVIKKPRTRGGNSPARGLQNTNPQWVVATVGKKKYLLRISALDSRLQIFFQINGMQA